MVTRKKRRVTRKKPISRAGRNTARKSGAKKKAFGGYTINFKGCKHNLEGVFGKTPLAPSQMTKKLWAYVKRHKLNK